MNKEKISKKATRKIIFKKLSAALAEYKDDLKKKKIENGLKKISKTLADDFVNAASKYSRKAKKARKKDKKEKKNKKEKAKKINDLM